MTFCSTRRLSFFDSYLTLWIIMTMAEGVAIAIAIAIRSLFMATPRLLNI